MDRRTALIIVAVVAVAGVLVASIGWAYVNDEDGEFTFEDWLSLFNVFGDSDGDGDNNDNNGDDGEPPDDYDPEDTDLPSDIDIFVDPSVIDMGDWVLGQLTGDGHDYSITTKVVHKGSGQSQSIGGWVDSDGQYELPKQINTPGYWEFQTTAQNGIKSNVAYLTVRGILVNLEAEHYSKTFRDSLELRAFTHYAGEYVLFVAHDPATSSSTPLGTSRANSGGYATLSYNFDSFANGNYEIDAIVGSDSATSWSGTAWLEIGR